MNSIRAALAHAYASLAAWADLIDRINVFPVADSDTGTNLRSSLAPLTDPAADPRTTALLLTRSALGNSGNIGAAFFKHFILAPDPAKLANHTRAGHSAAQKAVSNPRRGTMPTVFAELDLLLADAPALPSPGQIRSSLARCVLDGRELIPELRAAGVVDAGALAMFIFFDTFFHVLAGESPSEVPVLSLFSGSLDLQPDFQPPRACGVCVNAVISGQTSSVDTEEILSSLADSLVVSRDRGQISIHAHTAQPEKMRARLAELGPISRWQDEPLQNGKTAGNPAGSGPGVHILTDGAASLSRDQARGLGISLLEACIIIRGLVRPESLCDPEEMYQALAAGDPVSTAQPPDTLRSQLFSRLCREHDRVLYLSTGSAFTGNFQAACRWLQQHDRQGRFTILDTGAASGRLALIALLTARRGLHTRDAEQVIVSARQLLSSCREYVFIDKLRYLAAGGRISRTGGLVGDLLHLKPIITPMPEGVHRLGAVRSRRGQLNFLGKALAELPEFAAPSAPPLVLLQYTDNRSFVESTVQAMVCKLLPGAEILIQPLSLSSGVHMGPGTWALALGPQENQT